MSHSDLVHECYGSERQTSYRIPSGSNRLIPTEKSDQGKYDLVKQFSFRRFFQDVFLPQGYPDSVTDDYMEYQCWDTLQAFCSSLTGALATEAILKSVGVGDESATALAATLIWLLKDGTGKVGCIAFAWAKGSQLDCDSKKWRLVADFLNDLAIFVDILTPYFKPLLIYLICFSSICRSIVGVAGGATRAALTQHQARRNNLADVSAKDGSQETLVNLSALICSYLLIPMVSGKTMLVWTSFCVLTLLHLISNYRAVRALRMDTVNQSRYYILFRRFLGNASMTIRDVNQAEPLLTSFFSGSACKVQLGCRLGLISTFDRNLGRGAMYQICINVDQGGLLERLRNWWRRYISITGQGRFIIRIALHGKATAVDVMRAAFHAELIRNELLSPVANAKFVRTELIGGSKPDFYEKDIIESTKSDLDNMFPSFLEKLKQHGWITTHTLLYCDEWRYYTD